MKDINKEAFSDFESGWQKAFEDAEMSPAKDIWNNIDAKLANKESSKYKKKVAYYRWVAAASVLFAIGLSYFSLNNNNFDNTQSIASENTNQISNNNMLSTNKSDSESSLGDQKDVNDGGLLSKSDIEDSEVDLSETSDDVIDSEQVNGSLLNASEKALAFQNSNSQGTSENSGESNTTGLHGDGSVSSSPVEEAGRDQMVRNEDSGTMIEQSDFLVAGREDDEMSDNPVVLLTEASDETLTLSKQHAASSGSGKSDDARSLLNPLQGFTPEDKLHAALMEAPYIYSIPGVAIIRDEEKSKNNSSVLWAGLNLGSSLFDPNFQEGSNFQPQTSPALASYMDIGRESAPQEASFKESTDPGFSYSLGVNFGVRLTERFILQSGVGYAQRRSSTNSTTYLQNNKNISKAPAYLGDETSDDGPNALNNNNVSQDYQLLNSFEFVSVPLKAGYLIVDRKIGIMVLGGVSADIFLSNTLSENNDKIEETKVDAGSDSPFRDVNFNGVIGAEFSYKISRNYHLTLEPNYGVAINSFTKSASNFSSNPQTFGISAGLKFYLK